jgi:hypothetical protein
MNARKKQIECELNEAGTDEFMSSPKEQTDHELNAT